MRCNFSRVARYSLKFTCCSLLVVKSLVTRCKIRSLLVAEVARCNIRSLHVSEAARYKKPLVNRWKIRSLLVPEVACCKKSLVTRCKIRSLLVAEVARCKNLLVTRWTSNFDCYLFCKVTTNERQFYLNLVMDVT